MTMSKREFAQAESAQTGIARKVLTAVPISEAWTPYQIATELRRLGHTPAFSIIQGCLNSLIDAGLVREVDKNTFQRTKVKEESVEKPRVTLVPEPAAAKMADPLSALSELANNLRKLADEIDEQALAFQALVQKGGKEAEQLRQLRALLGAPQ